jgi:hypothetical protein
MTPARRAGSRCALLLIPLAAAACADGLLRGGTAAVDQREVVRPVRPDDMGTAKMRQAR